MLIRAQLATPDSAFMEPQVYNQIFTMHGTVMMFLFAIPFFEAMSMLLLPGMLGTRDMAFPRLGAYGLWVYIFGGSAVIIAMLMGLAPDGGWFMYPPLSSAAFSPGIGADVWLLGITSIEVSAIATAIEVIVTVLRYRAAGMSLSRMPIFAWYILIVSVMILTAFPPMILGSLLLEVERAPDWPFFQVENGGDPLLWQHLFWLFGHPEVYIIFLPAAGMIATILPVMARTKLLGYAWVVAAAVSLAVLSFGLWVHHMFTTGIPHMGLAFFSAASTLVAVPTSIMLFSWIGTLWKGRVRMDLPMLWIIGFFATFVIGGLTGVMLAVVPFNWQVHDTHFVVAHLHYVLIGGYVFPMVAAIYYFMPLLTGRTRFFKLGEVAFWLVVPSFHITFLAVHMAGLLGQRRRIWTYDAGQGWETLNLVASIASFLMAIGFALIILDVAVNAFVAVRGLGSRADEGLVDTEHGVMLPPASESGDPPGWWGSLFLLLADGVHFGSLLFGHAFLWTVSPNWPPQSYLSPQLWAVALVLTGALALTAGPRLAVRAIAKGGAAWPAIALGLVGALALAVAAASVMLDRPDPARHAYDATLWLLAGHVGLHTVLSAIMLCYLVARVAAGYASPTRIGEARPVLLTAWAVAIAVQAPGLMAVLHAPSPSRFIQSTSVVIAGTALIGAIWTMMPVLAASVCL